MMKRLPEELLIGILLHLPVKSLFRLRSVSKYFCKLIESPEFIHTHLNRDTGSEEILLLKRKILNTDTVPDSIDGQTMGKSVVSFHSCDKSLSVIEASPFSSPDFNFHCHNFLCSDSNGLVCITSYCMGSYVFNPALREYRRLSPSPFGCHESKPVYHSGFGLDPKTKAYKLVHIVEFDPIGYGPFWRPLYRIELYDLRNDCWRVIDGFTIPDFVCPGGYISFNGVCYWISVKDGIECILCFDLSTETFGLIEFPDEFLESTNTAFLLVLNESIAAVHFQISIPNEAQLLDIWVMKEYGVKESWVKQYAIGPVPLCHPLLFLKGDRLLIESSNGQAAICTLRTNEVEYLNVFGLENTLGAITYKESLVSVASLFKERHELS